MGAGDGDLACDWSNWAAVKRINAQNASLSSEMPSGWLKERALGGSSLGCGEDAWFSPRPRATRRVPLTVPPPRRPELRLYPAASAPLSRAARRARPAVPLVVPAPRLCPAVLAPSPRTLRRPAHHRAPRRAAPRRPAPVSSTRFEFAQINSNFPYLVKIFLDGARFTSYLSQLHFFADSRILLKEERPRGPRKNR